MPLLPADIDGLAARIVAAMDEGQRIGPVTDEQAGFGLGEGYEVGAAVARLRVGRGERPVGWKIGFTNTTIWEEYGVHAPIWGPMYSTTAAAFGGPAPCPVPLAGLLEPRLEPEIVLRLGRTPPPGLDEAALLDCVDAVGHGVEIVQSLYPGWRFRAADTVAALALHGRYRHGPLTPLDATNRPDWLAALATFSIRLFRNGVEADRGTAANILGGGPLTALRHLCDGLPGTALRSVTLRPGDLVTTGTLTRAFPVQAGERWTTELAGIALGGFDIVMA